MLAVRETMTGSEQIDGLQVKVADRKNRWKPPGTKQTSRSRCGGPRRSQEVRAAQVHTKWQRRLDQG